MSDAGASLGAALNATTVGEARAALHRRLARGDDNGANAGCDEGDYLLCHVLGCGCAELYDE